MTDKATPAKDISVSMSFQGPDKALVALVSLIILNCRSLWRTWTATCSNVIVPHISLHLWQPEGKEYILACDCSCFFMQIEILSTCSIYVPQICHWELLHWRKQIILGSFDIVNVYDTVAKFKAPCFKELGLS